MPLTKREELLRQGYKRYKAPAGLSKGDAKKHFKRLQAQHPELEWVSLPATGVWARPKQTEAAAAAPTPPKPEPPADVYTVADQLLEQMKLVVQALRHKCERLQELYELERDRAQHFHQLLQDAVAKSDSNTVTRAVAALQKPWR